MKRRARFDDGGMAEDDLEQADRRFRREQALQESSDPGALYDETSGKALSTRRNLETGDYYSTAPAAPAPRAAARPAAPPPVSDTYRMEGAGRGKPSATPSAAPGQIPVDKSMRAPASTGEMPGETERNIRNLMNAATPGAVRAAPAVGRGLGALASSAREGWKEGEKVKQVARAAERGAKSRAEVQAKRTARKKSEAEAMEKAKPILQSRKDTKPDRLKRTKFDEDMRGTEFNKGGMASRRGDGCAQRGKTRGKMV